MADYDIMPNADNPAWPGVKLADGQLPVIPVANKKSNPYGTKDWGAPIAPVIVAGVPWEAAPGPLEQESVWNACRLLLNSGCTADSCITVEGMLKKWERQQVADRPAEKSWPEEVAQNEKPQAKKGTVD